jgi:hypothetical protein
MTPIVYVCFACRGEFNEDQLGCCMECGVNLCESHLASKCLCDIEAEYIAQSLLAHLKSAA